jgi:hypothetical protein
MSLPSTVWRLGVRRPNGWLRENVMSLEKQFADLAAKWRKETRFSSKAGRMAEHPAYREIVAMGKSAVALILADLEKNGGHWFIALHQITGANPVPEKSRGKVKEMAAAWLEWGRKQGYRW